MVEKNVSTGGRGTSRRIIGKDDKTSSGPMFANLGNNKKTQSSNQFISVGRGTGKIQFGDIAPTSAKKIPEKASGKGKWIRTGRGTGRIWVK
ncbi:MAG: hypothetical protein OEL52_01910 [Nitrosopumilus sp.]|nr:hypothetical protein [Nitrosopumilus sp.]